MNVNSRLQPSASQRQCIFPSPAALNYASHLPSQYCSRHSSAFPEVTPGSEIRSCPPASSAALLAFNW